jgi:hypothetical protein
MKRFLAAVLCLGIGILAPIVLTGCDSTGDAPKTDPPKVDTKPKDDAAK